MRWPAVTGSWSITSTPLVELKKSDGTFKKLYNYWVLGQFATDKQPRWSVIRNLLHWVD